MSLLSFTPSASVTAASTVGQQALAVGGTGHFLRVVNAGSAAAYLAFYEPGTTPPVMATATSMVILPGSIEMFSVASDTTLVGHISAPGGTTLNITRGEGM